MLLLPTAGMTGCGESTTLDLSEKFTVAMAGVYEAPEDVSGNAEPRSMSFTLQGVTLSSAEGEDVELFEDEPTAFNIINRPQIIAEADVADYVGTSFSSVTVTFAAAVTAVGKTSDELSATLTTTALVHTATIEIAKAKSNRLNIGVQWKNIINYDDSGDEVVETLGQPAFTFELKSE
jgi:hypothetical protein